jgi:hypothetical protein
MIKVNNIKYKNIKIHVSNKLKKILVPYIKITKRIPHTYYHITLTKNINNIFAKKLDPNIIYVIDFKSNTEIKTDYPIYPIYIKLDNIETIILSAYHIQQINGFNNLSDLLNRLFVVIGGIGSNTNINYNNTNINIHDGYKSIKYNNTDIRSLPNVSKVLINSPYQKHMHGWMSKNSSLNLKYALETYKPKLVVELGSWLGKSSKYIKEIHQDCTLYAFDKFQHILQSGHTSNKIDNLDKNFYLEYLRLETYSANLSDYDNVYIVQGDINNAISTLTKYDVKVDMFYVDFEKNTGRLIRLINDIHKYYPNCVIVGDDHVFESVKKAVRVLEKNNNYHYWKLDDSYISIHKSMVEHNYDVIKKESDTHYGILNELKKIAINKSIKLPYDELSEEHKYIFADYLLKYNQDDLLEFIKKLKLDLNKAILENNNTLYHNICMMAYKSKLLNLDTYTDYQSIKPVKNQIGLTAYDYLQQTFAFA